ncbi:acetolactate synthase large subunit [Peptoclostridium acidaminophilum DSM 3953]|uniref:Acetolactate synthase n=1 Tax=Peptoclostridium acidaminophilum DSM 3953 TaxID=1286171 RepID=W8TC87_PEPAC|nr:biosynthetic-type acetolactate synthase large subunit [Peptoclostridium acidaminophilum]AHM55423.1 acetolactate synthase large subunit [Peptoclostridium acidaminophilum DSM 3953]
MKNGANAIIDVLIEMGVDTVFGYPGGAVVPLYDALYSRKDEIRHIRTSHEQGASFAADGYARATGNVGVCIATSGPGATNLITGIAGAYMDSVPMVIITGQVASPLLGKDSFQEIDIAGMTFPITKHNYVISDAKKLVQSLREAFLIARTGRPGPVLIDIPRDIFLSDVECECKMQSCGLNYESGRLDEGDIESAADMIKNANRPVIYAGGGVLRGKAAPELLRLAEKGSIPVANTLMGISSFPGSHDLSLGLSGMHGHVHANRALAESDLVIAIGARFSDRGLGKQDTSGKNVIHIDIDDTEMGKNVESSIFIRGDIKKIISMITEKITLCEKGQWLEEISCWSRKAAHTERGGFTPKLIIEKLSSLYDDPIVATDVGQHQLWTAQNWKFDSPGSLLTSGGLGAMGYGLGAAIGAKFARPDKKVILITGDASFKMNMNELATVSAYKIPVHIVILNNRALGMVRQLQTVFTESRYSEVDVFDELDFVSLGKAFNIDSRRVRSIEELEQAVAELQADKSAIIECVIDKEELVTPMVRPGAGIGEFVFE